METIWRVHVEFTTEKGAKEFEELVRELGFNTLENAITKHEFSPYYKYFNVIN